MVGKIKAFQGLLGCKIFHCSIHFPEKRLLSRIYLLMQNTNQVRNSAQTSKPKSGKSERKSNKSSKTNKNY